MVQLANLGKLRAHSESSAAPALAPAVKMELEDQLEEEHGPLNKKMKPRAPAPFQQWGPDAGMVPESTHYNLLEEPSPLGLRLRKSPSLLDLIQMKLSQGNSSIASCATSSGCFESGKKRDLKCTAVSGAADKLKASNFPASLLRIGSWECVSRYEGDLVAKCYYAKHKLVWEVLDGGLKNKIEIQWSDITALKANCPENGPGTLDIVLARQPLFFRETNPQPRKHTLWQATSDFTNGQASIHRRHYLECPQGLLNKHFEKLIQCDPRLNSLSQQPEIILESPYFETRCSSVFENQDESKSLSFDDRKDIYGTTTSGFHDSISPCAAPSTSTKNEMRNPNPFGRTGDCVLRETLSPSSVMDTRIVEENPPAMTITKDWDQIKIPGLHSSMSMTDLVNHIGHCISGQTIPGNPLLPTGASLNKSVLEELTQYLFGDSQVTSASDEQSLMSRVNSLCCLIQHKDPATSQTLPIQSNNNNDESNALKSEPLLHVSGEVESKSLGMSRKESYGELLLNLPRIASMPQFLFNIAEDPEYQAR